MRSLRECFAETVRARRKHLKLSQEAFADKVDMDRTSISRIERTAPNVSIRTVFRIAQALQTKPSALLVGEYAEQSMKSVPPEVFGHAVRDARVIRGLSQKAVGDMIGMDRNYVSTIERSEELPTLDTLEKFVGALDLDVRAIFG